MYTYMCFDLECLYQKLSDDEQSREDALRILLERSEEMIHQISLELQREILATENPNDSEIVTVAENFTKKIEVLCRTLLKPILSSWIQHLPPTA